MSVLKIKDNQGNWQEILTIKGEKGEPGSYVAGEGIQIENDTISTKDINYNDLVNKPTDVSSFTNDSGYLTSSTIIESGSNENGKYYKFADGTLLCTQKIMLDNVNCNTAWGSLYVYAESTDIMHTFPYQFVGVPDSLSIEIMENRGGYSGFWIGDYGRRHTYNNYWTGLTLLRPTSAVISCTISATSIGRWK